MKREQILKILLVLVGLIFSALLYPCILFFHHEPALSMMLSVYATLGVFLLLASRNPPPTEHHRLHGMVKLRTRRRNGSASPSPFHRSRRTDRCCRLNPHWPRPAPSRSHKAIHLTAIRRRGPYVRRWV